MSDSITPVPYDYGTPEYAQYMRGQLRGAGIGATALPVGAVSSLIPNFDRGMSVESALPGAVTGGYSAADMLQGLVQRAFGTPASAVKHLPGGIEAGKLSDASHDLASRYIPHMEAEPGNEGEQAVQNIGELAGAVGVPLPAGLPRAANVAAHALMPGPRAILPAVAVSTGLQALQPSQADAASSLPPAQKDTPSAPGLFDPEPSAPGLFDNVPSPVKPIAAPITPPSAPGLFDPVTQAEQDPSTWTLKQTLLGVVTGVAVLLAGRRILPAVSMVAKETFFPTPGAADLPGTTGSPATLMRQSVLDSNAMMKEYVKSTADTPIIGRQLQAKLGDITNPQASVGRYRAETAQGTLHGQSMPSIREWQLDGAALSPAQKDVFTTGMHYGNEIDNRFANFNTMKSSGFLPTDEQTRVNFADKDLTDLHAGLNTALADPQVKALMDTAKIQTDAMVDMMVRHGQLSVGEGQAMKDAHKYYVPASNMDNITENPMNSRNLTPYSGSDKLGDVFELRDQHDYQLYKMIDDNNARDLIISNGTAYQNRTVGAAEVLKPSKNPITGEWVARQPEGDTVAVRRNGELQHWQVTNRSFLDAMQKPAVPMGAVVSAMNKLRQLSQSSMTGAIATLAGKLFFITNPIRSAGEISVLRPKGMYSSHLDKLAQQATGGRIGFRGDPISPYIGTAYHMAVDPAAVVTKALGEMFAPKAPNGINVRMRALFGDSIADAISQRAIAAYNLSNHAAMAREGTVGSAGMTANDVTKSSRDAMSLQSSAIMPSYDMVPELFQANRWKGTAPVIIHLRNLFNEMKNSIGDAAHSNYDALNRGNPNITDAQRRYEVRNATGDPGVHGANRFVKEYMGNSVTFGNVAMQEGARVARALNEEPISVLMGYLTHYGTLAAASAFTAMLAGPEAVQHLFDSNTDTQRSSEANLYIPGHPTNPIRLPIMINMRPPFNLMVQMFHDMLSLPSHADNPDLAGQIQEKFMDFFSKHVWQSTIDGSMAGLSEATPPIQPVIARPIASLVGKSLEITPYNAYMHSDKPITQMFSYDNSGQNTHIPGQSGSVDPITGTASGITVEHIISDVFATAGLTMINAIKQAVLQGKSGGGMSGALSNLMQDYGMRARDVIPGANALWGVDDKLSTETPLAQKVQSTLDVMRGTLGGKSDLKNFGFTRKGGPQLEVTPDQNKVPSDPQMQEMYLTTNKYMDLLQNKPGSPLKEVTDSRKEIQSLAHSPRSPEEIRSLTNQYIEREQQSYVKVMAIIHMLNSDLSKIAGVPVDVSKVDFSKGPEQFKGAR